MTEYQDVMEKYEIKSKLGVGAHGSVFLVQNVSSKKLFALKKVEVDERKKSRSKEYVLKEASILSQLKHPHIVLFHESFWNPKDECVYIILDYCGGGSLADKIQAAQQVSIPFTEKQIMQWFIQIVMAVQYIHSKHILHRDLKTENVFLNKRNVVKVGDFGISKVLANTIDVAKTVVGTPSYLSPELCQDIPYNSKSDIWAVGCLLYEMCALSPPFDGHSLIGLMFNIINAEYKPLHLEAPEGIRDLVSKMLVKVPESRPSASALLNHAYVKENLASFIADTEHILFDRGLRKPPLPPQPPPPPPLPADNPIDWLDGRGDCGLARPQTAPPPRRQAPPPKAPSPAPVKRIHKGGKSIQPAMAMKRKDDLLPLDSLPEPCWDDSKDDLFKAASTTTASGNQMETRQSGDDDPSYYSDDFDESSGSEVEEDLPRHVEDREGKSEDEVYADDFEEYQSDEDLDLLVAQARRAQELEPLDEYFLEPEDELGLSQTLAMVQAGLSGNTSTC